MRKIYRELFYIPKHGTGKMREKAFLARITASVIAIIMCLSAMGITAYAWFSGSIISSSNTIQSAQFDPSIKVCVKDSTEAVTLMELADKEYRASLSADTLYEITLERASSSAKTGFVIITADGCNSTYHTQQIGLDGVVDTPSITIYLQVSSPCNVTFKAHWGTSSHYDDYKNNSDNNELYIINGETVNISVTPISGASLDDTDETTENTTVPPTDTTQSSSESTEGNSDTNTSETTSTESTTATDNTTQSSEITEDDSTESAQTEQTQPEVDTTESESVTATETPNEE